LVLFLSKARALLLAATQAEPTPSGGFFHKTIRVYGNVEQGVISLGVKGTVKKLKTKSDDDCSDAFYIECNRDWHESAVFIWRCFESLSSRA
jgi:hypothetical protein